MYEYAICKHLWNRLEYSFTFLTSYWTDLMIMSSRKLHNEIKMHVFRDLKNMILLIWRISPNLSRRVLKLMTSMTEENMSVKGHWWWNNKVMFGKILILKHKVEVPLNEKWILMKSGSCSEVIILSSEKPISPQRREYEEFQRQKIVSYFARENDDDLRNSNDLPKSNEDLPSDENPKH